MSRGREAARAANRRTAEAQEEAQALRSELARAQAAHTEETRQLQAEIKRLRADHIAEASRLAREEITRTLAKAEADRRARGLSDDIAYNMLYLKDKFVLNACKYISMTTGTRPLGALAMVMTWMTDEDFYGFQHAEVTAKLGLPADGWVARFIRNHKYDLRRITRNRIRDGQPAAVTLDRAFQEGDERIHPAYDPRWYPAVEYPRIELVDDEAS